MYHYCIIILFILIKICYIIMLDLIYYIIMLDLILFIIEFLSYFCQDLGLFVCLEILVIVYEDHLFHIQ